MKFGEKWRSYTSVSLMAILYRPLGTCKYAQHFFMRRKPTIVASRRQHQDFKASFLQRDCSSKHQPHCSFHLSGRKKPEAARRRLFSPRLRASRHGVGPLMGRAKSSPLPMAPHFLLTCHTRIPSLQRREGARALKARLRATVWAGRGVKWSGRCFIGQLKDRNNLGCDILLEG
jgi:hypothetical protein